jgi:hypothetical protein
VSERSGLIESPGVWFIHGCLRSHGYDYTTLETMVGKSVTPFSWRVGDIVAPRITSSDDTEKKSANESCDVLMIGRVVVEAPGPSSSSLTPHSRQSGNVVVEFVNRAFADAVGIKLTGLLSGSPPTLETRKIRTSKLVHSTELHGNFRRGSVKAPWYTGGSDHEDDAMATELTATRASDSSKVPGPAKSPELLAASVSEMVRSEIEAVSRLDRAAIDSIAKECRKSSDALASLFSAGLPDSIMSAIGVAERQMNSLEPRDDLSEKLAAVGDLAYSIAEQLFSDTGCTQEPDETESIVSPRPAQNLPLNPRNHSSLDDRRPRAGDAAAHREAGREDEREGESQGMVSSLQQRRNMLLSLVSRASRRSNASAFLNEMTEAGIDPLGQLPPISHKCVVCLLLFSGLRMTSWIMIRESWLSRRDNRVVMSRLRWRTINILCRRMSRAVMWSIAKSLFLIRYFSVRAMFRRVN